MPESSMHRPVAQKILAGKVHEPGTIDFIAENCAGGDIIHAGAYFGDMLPALSQSCDEGFGVWAFEPNEENFVCLVSTVHGNNLKNINMWKTALGERDGVVHLCVIDDRSKHLGGGSYIEDDVSRLVMGAHYAVQMVALDDVYLKHERKVSLIHLDVEGYEWQALQGAQRIIEQYKPILVLEGNLESEWSIDDVLELGYDLVQTIDGNLIFTKRCNL